MSYQCLTPIYSVRVNKDILEYLVRNNVPLEVLADLDRLSKYLSHEDFCYHIYTQTNDTTFNNFCMQTECVSFLSRQDNVEWMEKNADNILYGDYCQRQKEKEELEQSTGTRLKNYFSDIGLAFGVANSNVLLPEAQRLVVLVDTDLTTILEDNDQELMNEMKSTFREDLLKLFYRYMGYDAFVQSNACKFILDN